MEAKAEIELLLKQYGAVLTRNKNHYVYKLNGPGGEVTFTRGKTPSDHRAEKNNLAQLRRALGLAPNINIASKGAHLMATQIITPTPPPLPPQPELEELEREQPEPEPLEPEAPPSPDVKLQERLELALAAERTRRDNLYAETALVEKRIEVLEGLSKYAADFPQVEELLAAVMPTPPPPPPAPQVAERRERYIPVTRAIVQESLRFMGERFTIGDILARLAGEATLSPPERSRIRMSIAGALAGLLEQGVVQRETRGQGKAENIWRLAEQVHG